MGLKINDPSRTTATTTATDDYLLIEGTTNHTRNYRLDNISKVTSGTVAPTSTPAKIGDIYVNTVLKQTYVANGTSSSADWIKQASSILENRHSVGGTSEPIFQNSWANRAGYTTNFYKDNFGIVRLNGIIEGGTAGTVAFTLPVGYRPPAWAIFVAPNGPNTAISYISIATDGRVIINANTSASLDAVAFRTN